MKRLMSKGLNPMQLAIVYKKVLQLVEGTEIANNREMMKKVIKEEYHKMYPNSFMPIDEKESTLSEIYNNYGAIEELANSLGIQDMGSLLECIRKGASKDE